MGGITINIITRKGFIIPSLLLAIITLSGCNNNDYIEANNNLASGENYSITEQDYTDMIENDLQEDIYDEEQNYYHEKEVYEEMFKEDHFSMEPVKPMAQDQYLKVEEAAEKARADERERVLKRSNNITMKVPKIEGPVKAKSVISQTISQGQALEKAGEYLDFMPHSKSGLIEQLEYDKFSNADSNYAANNIDVNWNEQAAKRAKGYLKISPYSKQDLIDQLEYDGFSKEETLFGVTEAGF